MSGGYLTPLRRFATVDTIVGLRRSIGYVEARRQDVEAARD
jgi:hypothetical protein